MEAELKIVFNDLIPQRERIETRTEAVFPDIRWDGSRRRSAYIDKTHSGAKNAKRTGSA